MRRFNLEEYAPDGTECPACGTDEPQELFDTDSDTYRCTECGHLHQLEAYFTGVRFGSSGFIAGHRGGDEEKDGVLRRLFTFIKQLRR